jgi:hypothetical protein
MPTDHERIEELLAGHALGALSGEDAVEADRLLSEHVPTCPLCREVLAGFRSVTDRLVLAPTPVAVPELLLARLRRSLWRETAAPRRGAFVAAAAGVAALLGMAALSMSLGTRATRAEQHLDRMSQLVDAISQPGASPVSLRSRLGTTAMVEVSGPTIERVIVAGRGIPQPSADCVYVMWVGSEQAFRRVGTLVPDRSGFVYRTFEVDLSAVDRILITEERLGTPPLAPSVDSPHLWQASL